MLQTARRLLNEGGELVKDQWQLHTSKKADRFSMDGALRRALDLAHPANRDEASWAAHHALIEQIRRSQIFNERGAFNGGVVLVKFNNHSDTTLADAITVYDGAIQNQGRIGVAVSKAKGRK